MPVSEPENRALLDFLYKAPNVYAVFTFGPYNNLSDAPRFDRSKTARRIITGILEKDATVGEQVSKLYNGQTNLKDAPGHAGHPRQFCPDRLLPLWPLSFSTPGWWAPKTAAPADTARGRAQAGAGRGPAAAAGTDNEDARFLKWADANKVTGAFTAWTAVEHPDFPGRKAEVGGIAPFVKNNPPVQFLADNASRHAGFLTAFATRMPAIELVNVKTEALGNGLTRVSAQVVNRGLLPTGAEIGDRVRYVPKMKVELKLANGQTSCRVVG